MIENMTEEDKKAFTDLYFEMHRSTEEAMNEAYNTSGWVYRDIPWMKSSFFDDFLSILGKDNYKVIAGSMRDDWPDGPFNRGQFLISPQGMQNLSERNADRAQL